MSALDCLICTAGSYCQSYGLSEPTGLCDIGYFCPGGQDSPTPNDLACSPGHFCYQGSHNQTGCPSGEYQPHWGQGDCDPCPAGSYCKAFGEFSVWYGFLGYYFKGCPDILFWGIFLAVLWWVHINLLEKHTIHGINKIILNFELSCLNIYTLYLIISSVSLTFRWLWRPWCRQHHNNWQLLWPLP